MTKNKTIGAVLACLAIIIFASIPLQIAQADELILQIPIGTNAKVNVSGDMLGNYIKMLFVFASMVIVSLAIVMVIVGAIQWIIFSDTPGKIGQAKDTIVKAFLGLFIALFSIFILQTVSPGTVNFKKLDITPAERVICCKTGTVYAEMEKEDACTSGGGKVVSMTECWNDKLADEGEPCKSSGECKMELFCQTGLETCEKRKGYDEECVDLEINKNHNRVCQSGDCGIFVNGGKCQGGNAAVPKGGKCSDSGQCVAGYCTKATPNVCEGYKNWGDACDGLAKDHDDRVCGPEGMAQCDDPFIGASHCVPENGVGARGNYCTDPKQCISKKCTSSACE